jgi:pimeloyl-ACP methyl ester carboxylesterase
MARARRHHAPPADWRGARLGAGPRLVLFHGGPGLDHRVLLPLAEQLAPHFEVWVPDLPGHGDGPPADPQPSALHAAMARVAASEGGADVLVGHSLGGWLLRDLLRQGRVAPRRGAVLIAPPAGGQPRTRSRRIRRQPRATLVADLLAQVHAETGQPPSARFAACLDEAALRGVDAYPTLRQAVARALAGPLPRVRPDIPVMVLSGALDGVVSPHQASEVALATAADLVSLPGVGHYPAATGDDGVAAAIVERLAG